MGGACREVRDTVNINLLVDRQAASRLVLVGSPVLSGLLSVASAWVPGGAVRGRGATPATRSGGARHVIPNAGSDPVPAQDRLTLGGDTRASGPSAGGIQADWS